MVDYRLVEIYPENGERHGKPEVRNTIYKGPDKAALKQAIDDWCAVQHDFSPDNKKRKPYCEYSLYYGAKRIYEYEL